METKESYLKDLMGHVMQIIYMIFLGVIIALFFGLGIDTFYPGPKEPLYPTILQEKQYQSSPTIQNVEEKVVEKKFNQEMDQYNKDLKPYSRNVSIIAIVLSVIALILSLTVLIRWEVIANGVMLGGVFTLGYSIIMGMQADDPKFRFAIITVGVVIALALGYYKFILPNKASQK